MYWLCHILPNHGRTFSIYLFPLSFWMTLPRRVLPASWWSSSPSCTWHCFLYYLSPGNSLVFSWCDHGMLASLLWLSTSSFFTPALLRTHSFVSFAIHETCRIFPTPFISKASRRVSSFLLRVQLSQLLQATLALSLVVSSLKSVCCDISSAMMPQSPALCYITTS